MRLIAHINICFYLSCMGTCAYSVFLCPTAFHNIVLGTHILQLGHPKHNVRDLFVIYAVTVILFQDVSRSWKLCLWYIFHVNDLKVVTPSAHTTAACHHMLEYVLVSHLYSRILYKQLNVVNRNRRCMWYFEFYQTDVWAANKWYYYVCVCMYLFSISEEVTDTGGSELLMVAAWRFVQHFLSWLLLPVCGKQNQPQ